MSLISRRPRITEVTDSDSRLRVSLPMWLTLGGVFKFSQVINELHIGRLMLACLCTVPQYAFLFVDIAAASSPGSDLH